jgi:putative ABC transport system substrate-binding protein
MINLVIVALSLILLGAPLVAQAQPEGKVPRIGWLTSSIIHEPNVNAFREGMRDLGYREVSIAFRAAAGHADRLPGLASDLVRLKVDVVVVDGGTAAIAAKQAILNVPVVIGGMADPVRDGIVASLARPGGNITGFAISTGPELNGKRLDLLREAVPSVARIAVVWNEGNPSSRAGLTNLTGAAKVLGIATVPLGVVDASGISRAFADAVRSRAGAILTLSDAFLWSQREHIVAMAARYRLPAMYPEPEFVTAGGLLGYGPNIPDNFRRAATYVDRILKGARPGDLPVEQPTRFDLLINLKTAKALGLTIPPSLLARADQVIE